VHDRNRQLNLADALRALPLETPEHSVWPELAAELSRDSQFGIRDSVKGERMRRFAIPALLAAALAGIFVVSFRRHETPTSAQTTNPGSRITNHEIATVTPDNASSNTNSAKVGNVHNAATDAAQLAALQRRSQDLERWLSETGDVAAPLQGQDLLAATEIENLIGLVDVELTAKRQMQDTGLWKRRVDLLEDLSALRYSNYQLAAGGRVIAASLTN